MKENRLMQQVMAIFSTFMVFFYLGAGVFLIFFFDFTSLDKSVRIILGSTFIFYGLYRAFRAYSTIVELFFTRDGNER